MSNPAVTKLVRDRIGKLNFWMDDNIGESVHIHLADFRLDLTTEEVYALSEELTDTVNRLVDVEGFDCAKMDPVFLSLLLAKRLKHLKAVRMDEVSLQDLTVNYRTKLGFLKYRPLPESRAVKALRGDTGENDGKRKSHHVGQTSAERLSDMNSSIREHGYPYDGQYIILYEDQMLIRDGQHRASCLYVERGNVRIPVMRLYFDDPKVSAMHKSYIRQGISALQRVDKTVLVRTAKQAVKGVIRWGKKCSARIYFITHKKSLREMERVYFR